MLNLSKLANYRKHITKNRLFSINTMQIEEKQIELTASTVNLNISYVKAGQGNKAVLLMPGALGTGWTDFTPQINELPNLLNDYAIIAWDPPGYGRSRPPARNFTENFFETDALVAHIFMEKLHFDKFSVLGWSDGGIAAMLMAAKYPNAIDKLVIWGANAYILPEELDIYESRLSFVLFMNSELFKLNSSNSFEIGVRDISKWSKKMREPLEKLYGVDYFPKLWSDWVDAMKNLYKIQNGNLCKNEVHQIQAQTLILHGVKDTMIAKEHVPFLRNAIKNNL